MTTRPAREVRERRLEIEQHLADRGLLRGPRRVRSRRRAGRSELDEQTFGLELRAALEELGPHFRALGRFLSLRGDLLRPLDCLRLAEIVDEAPAMPREQIEGLLAAELEGSPSETFATFEWEPFASRWLHQLHRAWLRGGEPVVVKLARPERRAALADEIEELGALRRVLAHEHFDDLLREYRESVEARLDLAVEAEALQIAGRAARQSELLVVPQVYRELSSPGLLTTQWLNGEPLEELAARPGLQDLDAEDSARRLGLIWLEMALAGQRFPIDADVIELADGRLAVTGGLFTALPEAAQSILWSYLRATAEHFPDRAAAHLLKEVTEKPRRAAAVELHTRVRQAVPFRDGGWSRTGETLAEYALLHWRLLRAAGLCPKPHLDAFYQGLFWAARSARRFAPQSDSLGEALRDLDWIAGWNQLRQLTTPRQMGASLESGMGSFVELPQKVDQLLSLEPPGSYRRAASSPSAPDGNRGVIAIGLGALMVALVLLTPQWTALGSVLGLSSGIIERLPAALYLLLGLGFLRSLGARR